MAVCMLDFLLEAYVPQLEGPLATASRSDWSDASCGSVGISTVYVRKSEANLPLPYGVVEELRERTLLLLLYAKKYIESDVFLSTLSLSVVGIQEYHTPGTATSVELNSALLLIILCNLKRKEEIIFFVLPNRSLIFKK